MQISIIGGGIGGLATAVALSRFGHMIAIYEAASELTEVSLNVNF